MHTQAVWLLGAAMPLLICDARNQYGLSHASLCATAEQALGHHSTARLDYANTYSVADPDDDVLLSL